MKKDLFWGYGNKLEWVILYKIKNNIRAVIGQRSVPESHFASKNFNQILRIFEVRGFDFKVTYVGWDGTA